MAKAQKFSNIILCIESMQKISRFFNDFVAFFDFYEYSQKIF